MLVVFLILDAVITVPLFVKDYSFFADIGMLIGYLETVVLAAIVGAIKK